MRRTIRGMPIRRFHSALVVIALGVLTACAQSGTALSAAPAPAPSREAALAAALPMPDAGQFETRYFEWQDAARQRPVAAKLYLPAGGAMGPVPLVIFSHGIGGSREGYTYLGKYWAANGIAALHLQHAGSDRGLWRGNPLTLVSRLQDAASEAEATDRARDLRFALNELLAGPVAARLDATRIAAAGHSYGANTTLLVAGARVARADQTLDFGDRRIRAAIVLSAPPFYGEADPVAILQSIRIPTLHITAEDDDIRIPGFYSGVGDRTGVFDATGSTRKTLVVFKQGSHSIFTDRLGTGGAALNPLVKAATRDLSLAFLRSVFDATPAALEPVAEHYQALLQRFDSRN